MDQYSGAGTPVASPPRPARAPPAPWRSRPPRVSRSRSPRAGRAARSAGGRDVVRPAGGVTVGAGTGVTDGAGEDAVALPEFPAPRVPDLTSMTGRAATVQKAVAEEVQLPPGVEVTGARCAADGSIVNRSGVTVGSGDDGSQVVSRPA